MPFRCLSAALEAGTEPAKDRGGKARKQGFVGRKLVSSFRQDAWVFVKVSALLAIVVIYCAVAFDMEERTLNEVVRFMPETEVAMGQQVQARKLVQSCLTLRWVATSVNDFRPLSFETFAERIRLGTTLMSDMQTALLYGKGETFPPRIGIEIVSRMPFFHVYPSELQHSRFREAVSITRRLVVWKRVRLHFNTCRSRDMPCNQRQGVYTQSADSISDASPVCTDA